MPLLVKYSIMSDSQLNGTPEQIADFHSIAENLAKIEGNGGLREIISEKGNVENGNRIKEMRGNSIFIPELQPSLNELEPNFLGDDNIQIPDKSERGSIHLKRFNIDESLD